MADETCRAYEVDGEPVVVRGDRLLGERSQAALAEVVRTAKEHDARVNPHGGVIQELHAAVRLAVHCIPDGLIQTGILGERDGAEVMQRLREAAKAARHALGPVVAESVHPGEILREELKARGLTQQACAEMIGRPVQVVNLIINGKKNIKPGTALDLERGLGISAGFWVRLQADHDLHVARRRRGEAAQGGTSGGR